MRRSIISLLAAVVAVGAALLVVPVLSLGQTDGDQRQNNQGRDNQAQDIQREAQQLAQDLFDQLQQRVLPDPQNLANARVLTVPTDQQSRRLVVPPCNPEQAMQAQDGDEGVLGDEGNQNQGDGNQGDGNRNRNQGDQGQGGQNQVAGTDLVKQQANVIVLPENTGTHTVIVHPCINRDGDEGQAAFGGNAVTVFSGGNNVSQSLRNSELAQSVEFLDLDRKTQADTIIVPPCRSDIQGSAQMDGDTGQTMDGRSQATLRLQGNTQLLSAPLCRVDQQQ